MFKKVKNILGIEGVKMELIVTDENYEKTKLLHGRLKFTSLSKQVIKEVHVDLIEKYARGRRKNKLIDEYKLGSIILDEPIDIQPNQIIEIEFELPFIAAKSEMDLIQDSNFFMRGLVKAAKYFRNVKSEYRVEAEAIVKGTKLNPTAKKTIKLK